MFKIAKAFNTPIHRFAVGDDVNPDQISTSGSQMTWDDLVANGFVKGSLDDEPAHEAINSNLGGTTALPM